MQTPTGNYLADELLAECSGNVRHAIGIATQFVEDYNRMAHRYADDIDWADGSDMRAHDFRALDYYDARRALRALDDAAGARRTLRGRVADALDISDATDVIDVLTPVALGVVALAAALFILAGGR